MDNESNFFHFLIIFCYINNNNWQNCCVFYTLIEWIIFGFNLKIWEKQNFLNIRKIEKTYGNKEFKKQTGEVDQRLMVKINDKNFFYVEIF